MVRLGASAPKNSRPSKTDSAKAPPSSRYRLARGTARISSRAKAMVSSATASAFLPGVFTTGMPRSVAAATSTLTGPPRAQQTSRSGAAPSTSALTAAPCTISTSCPATARATSAGVTHVLAQPALGLGDRRRAGYFGDLHRGQLTRPSRPQGGGVGGHRHVGVADHQDAQGHG